MSEKSVVPAVVLGGIGDWGKRTVRYAKNAGIEPRVVVGTQPKDEARRILTDIGLKEDVAYVYPQEFASSQGEYSLGEQSLAVVFTPPQFHLESALLAENLGYSHICVEKPIALTAADARRLENDRVYADDHYLLKALPLWHFMGKPYATSEHLESLDGNDLADSFGQLDQIGPVRQVQAYLVEGSQDSDRRDWLTKRANGGGVLLDLQTHTMAVCARLGVLNPNSVIQDVNAHVMNGKMRRMFRIEPEELAEVYVESRFTTGDASLRFVTGKVGNAEHIKKGKYIDIRAEGGRVLVDLENNTSRLTTDSGKEAIVGLKPKPYALMWTALRSWIDGGEFPDNREESIVSVQLCEALLQAHRITTQYDELHATLPDLPQKTREPQPSYDRRARKFAAQIAEINAIREFVERN